MPVIVPPNAFGVWLDASTPLADLRSVLRPFPAEQLEVMPVGSAVHTPRNEGLECLTPAA